MTDADRPGLSVPFAVANMPAGHVTCGACSDGWAGDKSCICAMCFVLKNGHGAVRIGPSRDLAWRHQLTIDRGRYADPPDRHPDRVRGRPGREEAAPAVAETDREVQHTFRGSTHVTAPAASRADHRQARVDPPDLDRSRSLPDHLLLPQSLLIDRRSKEPVFL